MFSEAREWKDRITHILDAKDRIERHTRNLTFDQFCNSSLYTGDVLRNFEIIGEATHKIPKHVQDAYPGIPWAQMYAMRNVVVHGYDQVSMERIWNTVQQDLPKLPSLLKEVLASQSA